MASIKFQKLVQGDKKGCYNSGSASIVTNQYSPDLKGKGHCKHTVIERLGRVIWLSEDRKKGIFLSETRGLIEYDLMTDSFNEVDAKDERISDTTVQPGLITHTSFGDIYYCSSIINKKRLKKVLFLTFSDSKMLERVICHILHPIIKNSARVGCTDFVTHSSLSYAMDNISLGTLDKDSKFFEIMGEFDIKLEFFKNYIAFMKEENPEFGKTCYVDSTPLPNDVSDNPFNAFSTHGTGGTEKQTRLVLLLDVATGKPVWFEFVTGNTLDHMTIKQIYEYVRIHLDLEIEGAILDAGYACEELFKMFNTENYNVEDEQGPRERCMVTRMPDRNGYPYGDYYQNCKDDFFKGQFHFVRGEHTYFGRRTGPVKILGYMEYVYTYVDIQQALALNQQYRANSPDEWDKLTPDEQNWLTVKDGFFNLISNKEDSPDRMLDEYLDRVSIEHVFKTPKEYLGLLPCRLWSIERIKGKVLCDVISTILYLDIRKETNSLGLTMPRLLRSLSAMEASLDSKNDMLVITTPNKQLRNVFETSGILVPGHIKIEDFKNVIKNDYLLESPSINARPKNAGRPKGSKTRKVRVPESAEQRQAKKAKKQAEQEAKRTETKTLKLLKRCTKKVCTEAEKVILLAVKGSIKCSQNALDRATLALNEARGYLNGIKENKEANDEIKRAESELKKAKKVLESSIT